MARRAHWTFLFVFTGALAGGCGYIRSVAVGDFMAEVSETTRQHDDVDLVLQALPIYLLLMNSLIEADRDNAELLRAAAEGYTAYAILVEANDQQRAARMYLRARDYGTAALIARRPQLAEVFSGPFSGFGGIEQHLHKSDLPYVFWAASSWGAWIGAHTESMSALADLPRVMLLMQWVLDRDETFHHGNAHVFLGVIHAALPPILGGDPELSLSHFEAALTMTDGQDLMAFVQMARFYARQTFDRDLYVSLLERVLASPLGNIPDLTLQNAAAQRLARIMLADVDVYF
jgi:hypothetical protein